MFSPVLKRTIPRGRDIDGWWTVVDRTEWDHAYVFPQKINEMSVDIYGSYGYI